MLSHQMKSPHFGRFFERKRNGGPFTLRELRGETDQNSTKEKNMNNKKCPDDFDSSGQARVLGNDKPLSGMAWWRSLSDNQRIWIYVLIGTPTVGAILLDLLFHSHMWFTAH